MLSTNLLDRQSFIPFGKVLKVPERAPDDSVVTHNYWDSEIVWSGSTSVNNLVVKQRAFILSQMERHKDTLEMLILQEGTCFIAVAPAGVFSVDKIKVFKMNPGDVVCLEAGVWHDLPFCLGQNASFLVIFKNGTPKNDLEFVKLSENQLIEDTIR
jgi:ureidoglycolate hydrolase